jgi:hypothetical protein
VSHAVQRVDAAGDAGARPQPEKTQLKVGTGQPDFSWYNIPKGGKYTKLSQNVTNGH